MGRYEPISILLPARDPDPRWFQTAVMSTLAQLVGEDELLIIDDGTRGGLAPLLPQDRASRISLVRLRESAGVGAALNIGIQAAKNSVICRMDADDVSFPWRRRVLGRMATAVGEGEIVFSTAVFFRKSAVPVVRRALNLLPISADVAALSLLLGNPFVHPAMMARVQTLRSLGGYDSQQSVEDYEFWLRASAMGVTLRQVALPTLAYRVSDQQATKRLTDADVTAVYAAYNALAQREFGVAAPPGALEFLIGGKSEMGIEVQKYFGELIRYAEGFLSSPASGGGGRVSTSLRLSRLRQQFLDNS